jgi:hypothetical protein
MNDDEVMELAQRAGTYTEVEDGEEWLVMSESAFPVFAKLIAEAEREACAQLCDSLEEQCEKLLVPDEKWPTPSDCAAAIRARGEK